jgi:hypothetical protein
VEDIAPNKLRSLEPAGVDDEVGDPLFEPLESPPHDPSYAGTRPTAGWGELAAVIDL